MTDFDSNATETRNVLVNMPDYPDSEISAYLLTYLSIEGNEVFPPKEYKDTLVDGIGTLVLTVPSSGAWLYRFNLPTGDKPEATLGAGSDIQLSAVLSAALSTETANSLTDTFVLKTGDTMTGPLTLSGAPTVDLHAATKLYVDSAAGGASDVDDLTTATGNAGELVRVAVAGGLEYRTTAETLSDIGAEPADATILKDANIGSTVQAYSAKTAAIAALTWAANSILLLTGTASASVQALATHVVTLLQSASAADARTAIGAGTGDGDVTAGAVIADNAIVRGDGGAKGVQSSLATIGDSGELGTPYASWLGGFRFVFNDGGSDFGIRTSDGTSRIFVLKGSNGRVGIGANLTPDGKLHVRDSNGSFMHRSLSGIVGSAQTVVTNGTGDVTLVLSGTFTISDGAGNVAGGVITATAPSGTFNLYDDGGTNTCQLQVAADGGVTVVRTAGARTYACNLVLNWL